MSVNADGKYPITLGDGRTVLAGAVVSVDANGAPVGGGGGGLSGEFQILSLTDIGHPDGNPNANADYSSVAGRVYLLIPGGYQFDVYAVRMFGSWSGAAPTLTTNFFNIAALTNGIEIGSADSGGSPTLVSLWSSAHPLRTNFDWFTVAGNYTSLFSGASSNFCFQRTLSSPLTVVAGTCFQARLNDDFSALTGLRFEIEGRLIQV